ncbi:ABC transporter ATP-binding protein [Desulfocurvibacter africanus]|uniref:Polyamine-transporting ATPase n=1 Tax=Desulfocurvibacter africanus subsp. africanus str. Walvis Bay TaxID=690850 RepID=F3YZ42_DESAF|nr:ABC transporter ATP-binding protein [Desulfocurvibacter africanus]EGJ50798.1 Polyamine-transporting ATPase [Desulfocurvibacter africanus subsp. africanus str. Walvis Bay]
MSNDLSVLNLSKRFGTFTAVDNISFDVPTGFFFSILGPSGCGKTTLLRMLAGFDEPSEGTIAIRGQDMRGVPPNRRPVNLVFQHLALFPMMDVAENIAFGLKRRGVNGSDIKRRTEAMLERVGLPGFGTKKISQLSGGQKQRVAIARCLVLEPLVLLLDEPLGALDLKLREQMKVELKKLQAKVGTTFIYITHDQSEALVMSDRVAVMNQGHFEQVGTPQELYGDPRTPFVAQFVGENNLWAGQVVESRTDGVSVRTDEGLVFRARLRGDCPADTRVQLFLRPEAMLIEPRETSGLNLFKVTVKAVLFDGANSRLLTATPRNHELLVCLPQNRRFDHIRPGQEITVGWHPESGVCFPAGKTAGETAERTL